jgi:hypothetical protein
MDGGEVTSKMRFRFISQLQINERERLSLKGTECVFNFSLNDCLVQYMKAYGSSVYFLESFESFHWAEISDPFPF